MMTGTHSKYNRLKYKHEKWLAMLKQEIIDGGVLQKIEQAKSLEEVYRLLNSCSFLGGFLSYQYAIDLNYSPYINFSENSFVKAGIGAIRGIKNASCRQRQVTRTSSDSYKITSMISGANTDITNLFRCLAMNHN